MNLLNSATIPALVLYACLMAVHHGSPGKAGAWISDQWERFLRGLRETMDQLWEDDSKP